MLSGGTIRRVLPRYASERYKKNGVGLEPITRRVIMRQSVMHLCPRAMRDIWPLITILLY